MQMKQICSLIFLGGCSAHQYAVTDRSDELQARPIWANIEHATFDNDGNHHYMAFVEVDGNASKSAALNMSDEKALSDPMRALITEFLDQNQIGEELGKNEEFGKRIISASRGYRPSMPSLQIVHRYWERITDVTGRTELRAYSLASVSMADFERAKENYLAKLRGDPEVKKILDEVGAKQRANIEAKNAPQKEVSEKN